MAKKEFSIQDIISNEGVDIQDPINGANDSTIEQEPTSNNEQEPASDSEPASGSVSPNITPVRYNGGETERDSKGNIYSREGYTSIINAAKRKKETIPITARKGEPQYGNEWAEDAAQMAWDKGWSADEIEAEMNRRNSLAAAQIKDSEKRLSGNLVDYQTAAEEKYLPYYKAEKKVDPDTGEESWDYKSPMNQTRDKIIEQYGLIKHYDYNLPFKTLSLINKVPDLKNLWKDFISIGFNNYRDAESMGNGIKHILEDKLSGFKSEKELKKLGVESQEDLNRTLEYLEKSIEKDLDEYKKMFSPAKVAKAEEEVPNKEEFKEEEAPKAEVEPVVDLDKAIEQAHETRAFLAKAAEEAAALKEENAALKAKAAEADKEIPNKEPFKEEENIKEVAAEEPPVDNITENEGPIENSNEEQEPVEDDSFAREMARLDAERAEQEKQALEEAEKIANKQKLKKEAEKAEATIEEAARKARERQFEYEDWLKNPTLISGIFGKSGLSAIKRVGLGLATLFSIFSDVAANYGRGINNSTDFKNTAMDMLNSTIKKIQDTRAESIGKMAAKPYETTAENEAALNKDYAKLKRGIGAYIPEDVLKVFIQEAQIDTDEAMSEDIGNRLIDGSREGYIDSIKKSKNKALKMRNLDEDGNLTPEGEVGFLEKMKSLLPQFRNVLRLSNERLENVNNLLDMEIKRAEVRSKIHDVTFNTNIDYINAINALKEENRVLEASKLEFTSATTLSEMLDLAGKNRSVIAGLSTSNTNKNESTTDSESSLERYTHSNGFEKVNETLKKWGWQAELNGEVETHRSLKLLPIAIEISGGGKKSKEDAEKFLRSEYEKWSKDDQKSNSRNSAVSSAAGKNIDDAWDDIVHFLETEDAKSVKADIEAVRKRAIEAIDNKIEYNDQVIQELEDQRRRESRFDTGDNDSVSTKNPYVSMYNDVPTKNSDWYKHRLGLS